MVLIIDLNSILTSCLLVGKDDNAVIDTDGTLVNSADYGKDNFIATIGITLGNTGVVPVDIIGVFDSPNARSRRQKLYPEYKKHRKERSKLYYTHYKEVFQFACDTLKSLGAKLVSVKNTEADDVIAHIAPKIPNSIIWSKDKDLLSVGTAMYIDGSVYNEPHCEDRFSGILRRHIRLYRTLVGDPGDFGPGMGVPKFGEKAFTLLRDTFGDEGLDLLCKLFNSGDLSSLAEDVAECAPIKHILDNMDKALLTWKLAGWLPIRDYELMWEAGMVRSADEVGVPELAKYGQNITLVDSTNYSSVLDKLPKIINAGEFISVDIETDVPQESRDWIARIIENVPRTKLIDVLMSKITGISITVGKNDNETFYFTTNHKTFDNVSAKDVIEFLCTFKNKQFVAHNAAGFELPVIYLNTGLWLPNTHCSAIAANYVDENDYVGLKYLSKTWLDYNQTTYEEVTQGRGMAELTPAEVLNYGADDTIVTIALYRLFKTVMQIEGTWTAYCAVEGDSKYLAASAFVNGINIDLSVLDMLAEEDKKQYDINYQVIKDYLVTVGWPGSTFEPLVDLTSTEVKRGYKILTGENLKCSFRIVNKIIAVMREIDGDFGEVSCYAALIESGDLDAVNTYLESYFIPTVEFNTGSYVQKGALLYDYMKCPVRYRNELTTVQKEKGIKQGSPSTDEDCIKWAIKYDSQEREQTVLNAVLKCVEINTRHGLYYHPYKFLAHWYDGKLHPSLKQSTTTTRRFAPSHPNVNQIPKRKEQGKKVRRSVVPHHRDAVLVSPDVSGQELRLGAFVSQDQNFLSCFIGEKKKDLHSITAFAISEKQGKEFASYDVFDAARLDKNHPMHKLAKEYRTAKAKPTNFLSQYSELGGGEWLLAKKLRISEDDAKAFLAAKNEAFPGVSVWKETEGGKIRARKFATTLLGAKKHVHKLLHIGDDGGKHTVRSALNFIIQSSGAEMTKLIMGRVWKRGLVQRYDAQFYTPIHDELLFSVNFADLRNFCAELRECMTANYACMTVPVESSLAVGINFGELDEYSWELSDDELNNIKEAMNER